MKMKRLFWGFTMIAALALLAGCGGGGTSLKVGGERATQDLIDALQSDHDDLATQLAAAMANATTLQEQLTAAQADVARLTTELSDEVTAHGMTEEQRAQAVSDLADAQANVTRLTGELTTANNTIADLRQQVADLTPPSTADPMAAAIAPAIADPDGDGSLDGALMKDERPNVAGGDLDGTNDLHPIRADAGSVDRPAAIRVGGSAAERPGWRETLAVTDAGDTLNKDEKGVDDQFMRASDGVPSRGSFTGEVHKRTIDKVTDKLTVYTNMDAPKSVLYLDYYAASAADPSIGTAANRDGVASATSAGVLTLTTGTKFDSSLYSGSRFPTTNGSFVETKDNSETQSIDERKFDGMFNGVEGQFNCDATSCTASRGADGKMTLTATGGNTAWTFTPTASASNLSRTKIPGVNYDADYLVFGYWLQATELADGTMEQGIQTFATGSQPYTVGNAQRSALTGNATYNGAAAGQFVRMEGPIGNAVATSSGHFTAKAKLTASFNQITTGDRAGSIAPNQVLSISGTVSAFTDVAGNAIDGSWSVDLEKAGFASSGSTYNSIDGDLPGSDTFGGSTTGGGSWQGQFFGATTGQADAAVKPSSVAGEFNAHFANGHVVGAFGAKQ